MAVASALFVLLLAAAPGSPEPSARPAEPACVQKAKTLVKQAEAQPMRRRARVLELAIRRDPSVFCGVIDQSFFAESPEAPAGCDRLRPATCRFPKGLEIARRLAEESDPVLYLRVQLIATKLKEAGLLTAAHERILDTLLLASQLAREEERSH